LTTDNIEQALERAGKGEGNKGFDSAMAALQMVGLLRRIEGISREQGSDV
jgi:6,7-dimethyl-8-ribityllumazine synthase